jgi:DNA polymerase kappa
VRRKDSSNTTKENEEMWDCPICQRPQIADERLLNEHIDSCLSKETIREAVNDTIPDPEVKAPLAEKTNMQPIHSANGKKRGRPKKMEIGRSVKQKTLFP